MMGAYRFHQRRARLTLRHVFALSVSILFLLTIAVPNSLQLATIVMMFVCAAIALPRLKLVRRVATLLLIYLLGVVVTILYLFIGVNNGAPMEAVIQVFVIYILSPFLWIIISICTIQQLGQDRIEIYFARYGALAVASVGLFYFLYLSFGANAVSFFQDKANLNVQDGYAASTMFVYGSLIFLVGGFFSCPTIVSSGVKRALLLGGLAVAAITSGRAALILSIPIGLLLGILLLPHVANEGHERGKKTVRTLKYLMVMFVIGAIVVLLLSSLTTVNLGIVISRFFDQIKAGGGGARTDQAVALVDGIKETFGLGAGHGVGVDYIRSTKYPWRYELIWLATVFRVGVAGFLIYAAPFLFAVVKFFNLVRTRVVTEFDVFVFSAFFCALLASNTNPYIEAFVFQWMYVLPVTWFFLRETRRNNGQKTASSSILSCVPA